MEYIAIAKSIRMAPRKVRLVADAIRKQKSVEKSLINISLMGKRSGNPIAKTLESALANAVNKGAKKEDLTLKSIEIMEGPAFKRFRPSTRGRIHPYKKRSSHIKIILEDAKIKDLDTKVKSLTVKGDENGTED